MGSKTDRNDHRPNSVPFPLEGEDLRSKRRIISLVPCITETLLARGFGDRIVGVTRYCPDHDGAAIVGGVWDLDFEQINALSPDLVLADPEEQRDDDLEALEERLPVQRISVRTVEEALAFAGADANLSDAPAPTIPVVVPIWLRPLRLLGAGRYGDSLLRAAGFDNRVSEEGYPGAPRGAAELEDAGELLDGACLLLPTEPWAFDEDDIVRYRRSDGPRTVHVVDGRDLFWYGARTLAALERLRALYLSLQEGART